MPFLKNIINQISAHLLPSVCVLCSARSKRAIDLCYACEADLPWLTTACIKCALPLTQIEHSSGSCGQCLQNPPLFFMTKALFHYQTPIDRFITGLKFHDQLLYAKVLGALLAENLQKKYQGQRLPECIIPVPLHPARLRERGFNQALELARVTAKALTVPIDYQTCQRVRLTVAQSVLPAAERYSNIKNAFKAMANLRRKYVAIVDDVVTTGHTASELTKALHSVGVERVDVWCIARTSVS